VPPVHRILIIDDDTELCTLVARFLNDEGFDVDRASDGSHGIERALCGSYALIMLDVMMPDVSGFDVLRDIRAHARTPVLMLTARGDTHDRVRGLELGADDYVSKPFNPRELLARVKSVLRRSRALPDNLKPREASLIRFAGWALDTATRDLLSPDGVVVALSGTEFKLLHVFLSHPNRILNRDQLIDLMLARDAGPFDRAIDVQVSRLRHRLADDAREASIIKTVRGQGYVFAARVEAA